MQQLVSWLDFFTKVQENAAQNAKKGAIRETMLSMWTKIFKAIIVSNLFYPTKKYDLAFEKRLPDF